MKALVVTDTHIAVQRGAGTTPQSAEALKEAVLLNFKNLIMAHTDKDLIHAGDIFDQFDVPNKDLLDTYDVLSGWLIESGKRLIILRANHDWSPRANKLSSWELMLEVLKARFPTQVIPILDTLTHVEGNIYAVGHVANQALFDLELEKMGKLENSIVFTHANYDNPFATGDHSLLITKEWARAFVARGNRLYSGHEHQKRVDFKGSVVMLGSCDATSISDCLGNDAKYAHIIEEDGSLTPIQTWSSDTYREVLWTEIETLQGDFDFIRVTGSCSVESSADALDAVAKLRQRSKAYVVANAIKIEGGGELDALTELSFEAVSKFNVMEALLEELTPEEGEIVKSLMEDEPCGSV